MNRSGGIVAIPLLFLSCGSHRHMGAPVLEASREGQTSVRVLSAPGAAPSNSEPTNVTITPAYPSPDNAVPVYPMDALKAGCRDGVVPVRVYVGSDGNVTDDRDIPGRPLSADSCHPSFRAAVQAAVRAWKFAPAFRQTTGERPEQYPIAVYLDYEFSFRVVEGKGTVLAR
jgi:outer membrane biosynthesis protein TonB